MGKRKPRRGRPKGGVAVYEGLAERLRARVTGGVWPAGTVLPSLETLAKEYGVGVRVVRSAVADLREEGWIGVNARRRLVVQAPGGACTATGGAVLEVIGNPLSYALKDRDSVVAELHRGIGMGAAELHAPVVTAHDDRLRTHLPSDLLRLPLRGIALIWPYPGNLLASYGKLNVPVVVIDRPQNKVPVHNAGVDNRQAAREATARLLALGHRRIAFVGYILMWHSLVDPDAEERKEGFFAAYREAGLPPPRGSVFRISDYDKFDSPPLRGILDAKPPFTAVLATDQNRAKLIIDAARARGMAVPRDLSVACFQPLTAIRPEISSSRVDFAEVGRQGVLLLGKPRRPPLDARVKAVWVEGRTVAPPRSVT